MMISSFVLINGIRARVFLSIHYSAKSVPAAAGAKEGENGREKKKRRGELPAPLQRFRTNED